MKYLFSYIFLILSLVLQSANARADTRFDKDAVQNWSDAYFQKLVDNHQMTGAGFAVVQDGKILFSKGYGYEDVAKNIAFDPANTKVRVCSNSKVIVATAFMTLFDQGVISSLSDPVNKYLKRFQMPTTDGKDVSVLNLLTHRTGYGSAGFGAGADKDIITPVSSSVYERLLPGVTVTPGEVSSYSNAALAVQGALIEDQTGQLLGDYLQEKVFNPFGMNDSLYHYQTEVPERLAVPYRFYPDGSIEAVPFFAKHPMYAPSGGVISTVEDMARFAIWHADEGRTATTPVLKPETFQAMHTRQVGNHPDMSGLGLQFFTDKFNGERMAQHGCGLPGFNTRLAIFPDSNTGFFISSVSASKRLDISEMLLNALTPSRMVPKDGCCLQGNVTSHIAYQDFLKTLGDRKEHKLLPVLPKEQRHALSDYEGTYVLYRSIKGTIVSIVNQLFTRMVAVHPEGGLEIAGDGPYFEVKPDFFQHNTKGGQRFAFERDSSGGVSKIMWNSSGSGYKAGVFNDPFNLQKSLLVLLVLSATGIVACWWPKQNAEEKKAAFLPLFVVLMFVAAALALLGGFDENGPIYSIKEYLNVGRTGRLWILAIAGNTIAVCVVAMAWFTYQAFSRGYWGTGVRALLRQVHYSLITIAGLIVIPFLFAFNVIGFYIP